MPAPYKTFTNPNRISIREWLDNEGYESLDDASDVLSDSVMPALCRHGCNVEPDGRCEHDCPSVLVALGVI